MFKESDFTYYDVGLLGGFLTVFFLGAEGRLECHPANQRLCCCKLPQRLRKQHKIDLRQFLKVSLHLSLGALRSLVPFALEF